MTGGGGPSVDPGLGSGAGEPLTFAYHRSLGPPVGVLLGIALVEAMVVHLVAIAWWGAKVAIGLGVVDGAALVMLARLLRSFGRRPVVLANGVLLMRTGNRLAVPIALADVAGLRHQWTAADIKARSTLNMALLAWPNTVVDLKRPIMHRRRAITAVAHCVDDPAALRTALLARLPSPLPDDDRSRSAL